MNRRPVIIALIVLFVLVTVSIIYYQPTDNGVEPTAVDKVVATNKVVAAVVPHHNIVAQERAEFFTTLANKTTPQNIILVSPDHFGISSQIATTTRNWDTRSGELSANVDLINALVSDQSQSVVDLKNGGWLREHGITNIIGDIKRVWPNANLIPIIIPTSTQQKDITALKTNLTTHCQDCFLIASVDFSHYQPAALAEVHDKLALRDLLALDGQNIWQAEVDSPGSLSLMVGWAKQRQATSFQLQSHTNSGLLIKNYDEETTSHIMGWFDQSLPSNTVPDRSFVFGGDVMLGRDIAARYQTNNFVPVWQQLGDRTFRGVDVAWVNFEGPIADTRSVPALSPNNLLFSFPIQAAQSVASEHINFAGLANNHAGTFGSSTLNFTRSTLEQAGVTPVGDPNQVTTYEVKANSSAQLGLWLVTVNLLNTDGSLVTPTIAQLQNEHPTEPIIVIPHWGIEYQTTHNQTQANLAKSWVQAGADLIVGGHPHVIQDSQIINGVPVFYSLGNLVFDQYFSVPTEQGILLAGDINTAEITLVMVPYQMKLGVPALLRGSAKQAILDRFCADLSSDQVTIDCNLGMLQLKTTLSN